MDKIKYCRKCGKPIDIITQRLYRKIIVDYAPMMVTADNLGDEYIRPDGSKMRGVPAALDIEHAGEAAEMVFRAHRCGDDPDEM